MNIQPLLDILNQEYDAQAKLLEIAESKKEAIIQNRTDELSRLTNQESRIVKGMADLEARRGEAVREYLREIGLGPDPDVTLTGLSKRIPAARDKAALLEMQAKLSGIVGRLKEINQTNQELIRSSLNYIEFTLDLLTATSADDMTYRNPAEAKSGFKSGMFDTKA